MSDASRQMSDNPEPKTQGYYITFLSDKQVSDENCVERGVSSVERQNTQYATRSRLVVHRPRSAVYFHNSAHVRLHATKDESRRAVSVERETCCVLRFTCCVSRFTHYAIRTFWYLTTDDWHLATGHYFHNNTLAILNLDLSLYIRYNASVRSDVEALAIESLTSTMPVLSPSKDSRRKNPFWFRLVRVRDSDRFINP